jgi:hypothetical protein
MQQYTQAQQQLVPYINNMMVRINRSQYYNHGDHQYVAQLKQRYSLYGQWIRYYQDRITKLQQVVRSGSGSRQTTGFPQVTHTNNRQNNNPMSGMGGTTWGTGGGGLRRSQPRRRTTTDAQGEDLFHDINVR